MTDTLNQKVDTLLKIDLIKWEIASEKLREEIEKFNITLYP